MAGLILAAKNRLDGDQKNAFEEKDGENEGENKSLIPEKSQETSVFHGLIISY